MDVWEINRQNAAAWDPHMVIPLLQWLRLQKTSYEGSSIDAAIEQILGKTTWATAYEQLLGKPAPEDVQRRALAAHAQLENLNASVTSFTACLLTVSREAGIKGPASALDRKSVAEWNVHWQAHLKEELKKVEPDSMESRRLKTSHAPFDASVLEACVRLGRVFFDFGEYDMTRKQLGTYLELVCDWCSDARDKTAFRQGAQWGLLAAYLALWAQQRDLSVYDNSESAAAADAQLQMGKIPGLIIATDALIEPSGRYALHKRTCLIYWAIYIIFLYYLPRHQQTLKATNSTRPPVVPHALEWAKLLDWVFSDRIISLIVGTAPHLLRYICVLAILNRRKELLFRAAVDTLAKAGPTEDPLPALMAALYIRHDFTEAQGRLLACSDAVAADFLLSSLTAVLEENSRLLIFETFCRIQRSISIDSMAEKLHMNSETAERWIVDLIRHAGLEAKIDSEKGRVEMASSSFSVYQQIIESTRGFRLAYT